MFAAFSADQKNKLEEGERGKKFCGQSAGGGDFPQKKALWEGNEKTEEWEWKEQQKAREETEGRERAKCVLFLTANWPAKDWSKRRKDNGGPVSRTTAFCLSFLFLPTKTLWLADWLLLQLLLLLGWLAGVVDWLAGFGRRQQPPTATFFFHPS
jgi:hypothetical protein